MFLLLCNCYTNNITENTYGFAIMFGFFISKDYNNMSEKKGEHYHQETLYVCNDNLACAATVAIAFLGLA